MPRIKKLLTEEEKIEALVSLLHFVEAYYSSDMQGFIMHLRSENRKELSSQDEIKIIKEIGNLAKKISLLLETRVNRIEGGILFYAPVSRFERNYDLFVRAVTRFWRER